MWNAPAPRDVETLPFRKTDLLFDFFYNSVAPFHPSGKEARAINTLGEALNSEWYTNRHGQKRMSIEELKRGPGGVAPPEPPFEVISGKTEGVNPGFTMRDARKRVFFVKFDPPRHPDLATAPDVIGTKFFYALGYNTPDNYILTAARESFTIAADAKITGDSGKERQMHKRDFARILAKATPGKDGRFRFIASRRLDGKVIGPYRYEGTRTDDPNDVVPHEDRRDLRGLHVFAAWLNHTDTKAGNTLDLIVEENGVRFVKHYLLDFGSSLGSDSFAPKDARNGNEYFIDRNWKRTVKDMAMLGLHVKPWEAADYPRTRSVGRFTAKPFNPDDWVGNYPNHAFENRRPDDEFWAAKQVMSFTDDDIRAIVATGEFSDPADADYLATTLIARRNIIGKVIFAKLLALDDFHVAGNRVEFIDLPVKYGLGPVQTYDYAWYRFENASGRMDPLTEATRADLPSAWTSAPEGSYFCLQVAAHSQPSKTVRVFLVKTATSAKVAAIQRAW